MLTQRHPFANVSCARYSHSTDALTSWLRLTPTDASPTSAIPQPQPPAPDPPPRRRSLSQTARRRDSWKVWPKLDVDVPGFSSRSSPGHFVKHSSRVTLLLSGQSDSAAVPEYNNGATIEGILAVPRPSGLLGLQVKLEGKMKLKEHAGSGSYEFEIINDTLFDWDVDRNASFPAKVTFRYTLPLHYTPASSREKFLLPSTYHTHLSGIPGFRVDISYAIVVYIERTRHKANWWRKTSRLEVPFTYRELSRPTKAGPFPPSMFKTVRGPRTVFPYRIKGRQGSSDDIRVELFLPNSQVCCLSDPIPFSVSLSAPEEILIQYANFRPSLESFHPLGSSESVSTAQTQLFGCFMPKESPVRIHLRRQTNVDVLGASLASAPRERTDISATKHIASGVVYSASREANSIVWSGHISVPDKVRCGGFVAKGIKVTDCLVLSLVHPAPLRSEYAELYECVPIRLTTETRDGGSGVDVTVSDVSG